MCATPTKKKKGTTGANKQHCDVNNGKRMKDGEGGAVLLFFCFGVWCRSRGGRRSTVAKLLEAARIKAHGFDKSASQFNSICFACPCPTPRALFFPPCVCGVNGKGAVHFGRVFGARIDRFWTTSPLRTAHWQDTSLRCCPALTFGHLRGQTRPLGLPRPPCSHLNSRALPWVPQDLGQSASRPWTTPRVSPTTPLPPSNPSHHACGGAFVLRSPPPPSACSLFASFLPHSTHHR